MRTLRIALASLALAACSSPSSSSPPTDAGVDAAVQPADERFVVLLSDPAQVLCMPHPLPTSAGGESSCKVIVQLPNDATCSTIAGLTQAPAPDVAAFLAAFDASHGAPLVDGSICLLAQLAAPCVAQSSPGWCYTQGSCVPRDAGTCDQAACFSSPSFAAMPSGAIMYLACPGDAGI